MMDKMHYENSENTTALSEEERRYIIQHEVKRIVREKFMKNQAYRSHRQRIQEKYGKEDGFNRLVNHITAAIKDMNTFGSFDNEGNYTTDEAAIIGLCMMRSVFPEDYEAARRRKEQEKALQ